MKAVCAACVWVWSGAVSVVKGAGRHVKAAAVAVVAVAASALPAWATDPPPLLPDTGIEWTSLVSEAAEALGAIVVVIIGAFLAFKLVKIGMSWLGKLGG